MAATAPDGSSSPGRGHRREAILAAAADLFSEQGYPATGIDEIGEAAGITGPGVYRHFDNKNDVLGAVVKQAIERVIEGVADVVSEADTGWEALEGLAENMFRAILGDRSSWAVLVREQRHLDPVSRRGLTRAHRLHIEEWVHALAQVRPDLPDGEARVIVHGVLGLAAPFTARVSSGIDDDRLVEVLRAMAMRVLREAGQPPP